MELCEFFPPSTMTATTLTAPPMAAVIDMMERSALASALWLVSMFVCRRVNHTTLGLLMLGCRHSSETKFEYWS